MILKFSKNCQFSWNYLSVSVFKISAGPRTFTGKIWVGPANFPSFSFFIIYKFWQNCASVRQVSDLILKTAVSDCGTAMALTLNVRGPSYLGLTRSISWLLIPGSLRRQDTSSHDIDYIVCVGPSLTRGRILNTCVKSMWSNDIKCKYMFLLPLKNLARNLGLILNKLHVADYDWSHQR